MDKSKFPVSKVNSSVKSLDEDNLVDVPLSLLILAMEEMSNDKIVF